MLLRATDEMRAMDMVQLDEDTFAVHWPWQHVEPRKDTSRGEEVIATSRIWVEEESIKPT